MSEAEEMQKEESDALVEGKEILGGEDEEVGGDIVGD